MASASLGGGAIKVIHKAVDALFEKLKRRFIGAYGDKRIAFGTAPKYSLGGLYEYAGKMESGQTPSATRFEPIKSIAEEYLDAHRASAKAQIVRSIQSALQDEDAETDFEEALKDSLTQILYKTSDAVHKIVKTEANATKNFSLLDSITQINIENNITDPLVWWICVHDDRLCDVCKELHLMPDGVTPRVWKVSECTSGYYKRGDSAPSLINLHPSDRCTIATLTPGYGFENGRISYISPDHDEFNKQRGGE